MLVRIPIAARTESLNAGVAAGIALYEVAMVRSSRDAEDLARPTKETSKYLVSHAKDADLNKAMNDASMGMIKMLEADKKVASLVNLDLTFTKDGAHIHPETLVHKEHAATGAAGKGSSSR